MDSGFFRLALSVAFLFPAFSRAQVTADVQAQKHFQAARQAEKAGDYPRAEAHLKKVAQLAPDEPTTHYLLAQVYRKLGRKADQNAEPELFAKLRKAERGRDRGAGILTSGAQEETPEEFPEELASGP